MTCFQQAAHAEDEDNIAEQRRQHGKRVRYGEVIQVRADDVISHDIKLVLHPQCIAVLRVIGT